MPGPKLVLPSSAMPWGRWVEDKSRSVEQAIARERQDNSSTGSQFRARADLMERQIAGVPSVADIQELNIPTFSVSRSTPPSQRPVYGSPLYAFSPPRPDRTYSVSVIAVIRASGANIADYPYSMLRINGEDTLFWNNGTPNIDMGRNDLSLMGTVSIGPGQAVQTQFGISTTSLTTVTFSQCQICCIFNGGII